MRAFGTPEPLRLDGALRLGPRLAAAFTFGVGVGLGGTPMPDLEHAGCILFWGYNPSIARISHATATVAALKRGARLIVVDPRRVGLANKADLWLRVRPGTDGALALGIADVMIERGWYDRDFVRDWTNGPLLVRADTGRLLTERDLSPEGSAGTYVAWDDARRRARSSTTRRPAATSGTMPRRPSSASTRSPRPTASSPAGPRSQLVAELCRRYTPETVEAICWVDARPGRGGRPPALGGAARRLLRLERRRAAHQRHPDRPRHRAALRAHRQLRRAGRQRALPGRAVRQCRRRGAAAGGAARPRPRPRRAAARARPRWSSSPRTSSTAPSWSGSPTRCAAWSASAPTCSSPTPTAGAVARRWRRSTSTSTPTCS